MRTKRVLLTVLSMSVLAVNLAAAGDWHQWRGPNRDSTVQDADWDPAAVTDAVVRWKANVGSGYSAVSVYRGRVFTMGNAAKQDSVICLDATTGEEIWRHSYACPADSYPGPRATPVIDPSGPTVYSVSREGDVYCLDARDGKIIWHVNITQKFDAKKPQWGHAGSALIVGDLLVLNAGKAGLALNKKTGAKVWGGEAGVCGYSTPVLYRQDGRDCIALFVAKGVVGLELKTGERQWWHPWETNYDVNATDPVVWGDKVFISSGYKRGCAMLSIAGGAAKQLWENKAISSQFSSVVLIDDVIYGIDGDAGGGTLRAINAGDGSERWQHDVGFGSLIAADGKLIVLNERATLSVVAVDPDAYRKIASADGLVGPKCWTMPVLADGAIFIRSDRGELLCLNVKKP